MPEKIDITLRPITDTDTENIIRWRNNPHVLHNFIDRRKLTSQMHQNWLHNRVQTGQVAQFIITRQDTQQDIGSVFLRDIDHENRHCEYGIFIGEDDARGKGIGTAACQLCLSYAFNNLGMHRVYLRVFADNPGAIASYRHAGFRPEGCLRQHVLRDGKFCDIIMMGILKEEFNHACK